MIFIRFLRGIPMAMSVVCLSVVWEGRCFFYYSVTVSSTFCLLFQGHHVFRNEVLQGVAVHLNCSGAMSAGCLQVTSPNSGDQRTSVTWHFVEADGTMGRVLRPDGVEFIQTQDSGLVIMDVRSHHNGTYSCSTGGLTVARHELRVLR